MTETLESKPVETQAKPKTIRWGTIAIWAGVIILLAVLGWGLVKAQTDRPDDVAPNFEMYFFDGYEWQDKSVANLSDFENQVVVLNFWASWCVECKIEADILEQAWRDYRDDGVVFLGVAYVDVEPKSIAYLEEFSITYPNAPDLRSSISSKYDITGVPETFFIGKDGKVDRIKIGPIGEAELAAQIEQMLAAPG
jgi:cytochrome c biogenesis protein CcmG/thiol:disulfide interchange protein DsbE